MDRKGLIKIPWIEMISLIILVLFLIFAIPVAIRGCSLLKKSRINEEQVHKFLILVKQINTLRIEDGEKVFPLKIDRKFQVETYGRCKTGQQAGVDCAARPKICLRDIANDKIAPYCEYIENTDFEHTSVSVVNGLKMKKVEKNNKIVTEIYS